MFNIDRSHVKDFESTYTMHRYLINRMNIFSLNISLINNKHRYLDRETYNTCFRNALSDIELVSDPIETIVPYTDEETDGFKNDRKFYLNFENPEAKTITERIDADVMKDTLLPGSELQTKFINNEVSLQDLIDDVYLYFIITKYCEQIDLLRFQMFSNMTSLIEYTVEFVTPKVLKDYIVSKKLNEKKYADKCSDIIFNPSFAKEVQFYNDEKVLESYGIKPFNLQTLLIQIASNTVIKTDTLMLLGIYGAISFAMSEIRKHDTEHVSPCVEFVKRISNEYINA